MTDLSKSDFASVHYDVDEKGCLSNADRDLFFQTIRLQPENRMCFDCAARNATWISATYSVFLCLTCSGQHRNLGSKISFVRSTDLDLIRLEEALRIEIGGNARARTFFRNHGILDGRQIDYRSKPAERYRKLLDKEVSSILGNYRPELTVRAQAAAALSPDFNPAVPSVTSEAPSPSVASSTLAAASERTGAIREPQYMKTEEVLGGNSTFFGSGVKAAQKPKTDDFDFDFETAFQTGTVAPVAAPAKTSSLLATGKSSLRLSAPAGGGDGDTGAAKGDAPAAELKAPRRDLTTAKGISSDDFKPRQEQAPQISANNLARFKNAQGISSEAYFGTEPSSSREGWIDDEMSTRLALIREGAIQRAGEVASAAQEGFKSAASWFSKISSTPSYL